MDDPFRLPLSEGPERRSCKQYLYYTSIPYVKKNLMGISERLKNLRKRLNINQLELAGRTGYSTSAISHYELGRRKPSRRFLEKLEEVEAAAAKPGGKASAGKRTDLQTIGEQIKSLQKEIEGLTAQLNRFRTQAEKPEFSLPEIRIYTKEEWKQGTQDRLRFQTQIPVLRDEAAAGSPREIDGRDIDSFIAVPSKFVPRGPTAYTGIYIQGDSMEPVLGNRFIVVVDHTRRDPVRLRGRMVAALLQDGVVVKWLARETRRDRIVLRSQNPDYEDIVLESPETDPIIGNVVFWWGVQ